MEPSTFSGSSKRPKAPTNSPQATVHCLVDGCNADLSLCRDYHRRHKVCEIHSKTSRVTIGGREQRFCQQCSRFHSLVEFDEGKRSCRKRLDGHNRRRRKPQPDSHARNSALIFSTHQTPPGTRLLSFANPPMLPTSVPAHTWSAAIKLEPEIPLYTNHPFTDCSPRSVSQLQFAHGNDDQPNKNNNNIAVSGSSSSDHALSLLSSAPPPEFRLNHVVLPPTQPLLHDIRYAGRFGSPIIDEESKAFGNTGASSAASTTVHFPEMFQPPGGEQPQSTLTGGPHQTLSFMWE